MVKNNNTILNVIVIATILLSFPAYSKDKGILRHVEAVSRDYYYVNIEDSKSAFIEQGIVGGEHEKTYYILGLYNESYTVMMTSIEGEPGYSLYGEGITIQKGAKSDIVTVQDDHTWITVSVSAHPFGEYKLTVHKNDQ